MNQLGFPLLSLVLWLPTLGALALLALPRDNTNTQRTMALGVSLLTLVLALVLPFTFSYTTPGYQFVDTVPWIQSLGVSYTVSVDGISVWLVVLVALLTPIAQVASWDLIDRDVRAFQMLLLFLASATIGVFVAQDMILFYAFFELTLIPTALLIGIWGGQNRRATAMKFFLYNFGASVFMLAGIIALGLFYRQQTGSYSFDVGAIRDAVSNGSLQLDVGTERLVFLLFFVAFAVKAPLWPFHTWLPDAHTEAPSDGSVDVLGLMIKFGAYGFIRYNAQLFPNAARWAAPAIATLAVISILYGAWIAYHQTDMKRLLAFSSVSHVGFIVLGIFALNQQGVSGAVLGIINAGLASGALFVVVGILFNRRQTRDLRSFGGLWKAVPVLGGLTFALVMASAGLPGLNGFIGEYLMMQGAWLSDVVGWRFVSLAVIGVILAAAYLLRMYKLTFMGDTTPATAELRDVSMRELTLLVVLLVPILVIGLYPNLVFAPMQPTVEQFAQHVAQTLAAAR